MARRFQLEALLRQAVHETTLSVITTCAHKPLHRSTSGTPNETRTRIADLRGRPPIPVRGWEHIYKCGQGFTPCMIAPLAEQDTSTSTFPIAHNVYLFRHRIYFIGWGSRTRTCVLRRMRSCWSHLQSYCHIRFAWLTSLVLRDCNPLIPVLALGRVTIKTKKMVRGCDLMQIRLGAEGGT